MLIESMLPNVEHSKACHQMGRQSSNLDFQISSAMMLCMFLELVDKP